MKVSTILLMILKKPCESLLIETNCGKRAALEVVVAVVAATTHCKQVATITE